jgi:hypothetical protein
MVVPVGRFRPGEFLERLAVPALGKVLVAQHVVEFRRRAGLPAHRIGFPQMLPHLLPAAHEEPRVGDVQMDLRHEVRRTGPEAQRVAQRLERFAITTHFPAEESHVEEALAAGVPPRYFLRRAQGEVMLSFPVQPVPQGAKLGGVETALGERQRNGWARPHGERTGRQRQGFHGAEIVP